MKNTVFYNLHIDDFIAKPLSFILARRRALKKYEFLVKQQPPYGQTVNVYVDFNYSSLVSALKFQKLPFIIRKLIVQLELLLWVHINDLKKKVNIVYPNKIKDYENLFIFSYKIAQRNIPLENIIHKHLRVFIHLSHYHLHTSKKSACIEDLYQNKYVKNVTLCADSDLRENIYFQKYFSWYKDTVKVLPFAIQPRFTSTKPWDERSWKVAATGTFHDFTNSVIDESISDISSFSDTLHPDRKIIHDNKLLIEENVSTVISEYLLTTNKFKQASVANQKNYFKLNIVDFYNEHKFAFIGEEITGGVPIGALEAMSCGCVLICKSQSLLGHDLIAGTHYIAYEDDILHAISLLKTQDEDKYREISINAQKYIQMKFSEYKTWRRWNAAFISG